MVFQSTAQLTAVEPYLYAKLEDPLINDSATLEQLREVFFKGPGPEIHFHIDITVESIPTSNCSACSPWETCEPAFCQVNEKASHYGFSSPVGTLFSSEYLMDNWVANAVVFWCAHGPSFMVLFNGDSYVEWHGVYDEPIKFSVKKLNHQPHAHQLTNAVGNFFTWVSVNFISILVLTW